MLLNQVLLRGNGPSRDRNLLQAACAGDDDTVRELLTRSPDEINRRWEKGMTPLIIASLAGHLTTVGILLSTVGVDVNACDDAGFTALLAACQGGHTDVCLHLLAARAPRHAHRLTATWVVLHPLT